jgi:DNA-binding FadR family transcriptional regulator
VSRTALFVAAQAQLRTYIQTNHLRPGDRLPPEADLAELCGVSRSAVREATRSLQTLGAIEARHGTGLYVSAFSFQPLVEQLPYGFVEGQDRFIEILQAREALEIGLMPAAASAASEADLAECARLAKAMQDLAAAGESINDTDRAFHLLLYKALNNSLVNSLIEMFWDLYLQLDNTTIPPDGGVQHAKKHLAIVDAIVAGDPATAMQRMQEHFDEVRARLAA